MTDHQPRIETVTEASGLRARLESRISDAVQIRRDNPPAPDTKGAVRWGRRVLWLGLAFALGWAALAPLGQGVPTHGFVKVQGNRKTIQHQRGGVVEEILVKEGDRVTARQLLVRLNPAQAQAQQGSIESQLRGLLAEQARLDAERVGASAVTFPKFLLERLADPEVKPAMELQRQLFATRRNAVEREIAINLESIAGLQQYTGGLQGQVKARAEQARIFAEELEALRPMYDQGFVPRNRMFELERSLAMLGGQRSEDLANLERAAKQIAELRLKSLQVRELSRRESETRLAEVQRQVADLKERRVGTLDELERVELRAPEAGVIVDMSIHTVGGVVAPGQKLMDLVPQGGELEVEVMIPPHLIDNVLVGQEAEIHFTALDLTVVPSVRGRLVYVSADRQVDPKTEQPFFVGRVKITPEGLKKLEKHSLLPGMPADVVIKTGERTLLGYLLKPLMARFNFAFTER